MVRVFQYVTTGDKGTSLVCAAKTQKKEMIGSHFFIIASFLDTILKYRPEVYDVLKTLDNVKPIPVQSNHYVDESG